MCIRFKCQETPPSLFESNSHLPFPVQPKKKHVVWDPMPELTITSRYIHSRVDSNKFNMRIGQPFARADLNPMAQSTFSPQSSTLVLWFWPQHNPNCRPPPSTPHPLMGPFKERPLHRPLWPQLSRNGGLHVMEIGAEIKKVFSQSLYRINKAGTGKNRGS